MFANNYQKLFFIKFHYIIDFGDSNMKERLLNYCMNSVKKKFPEYDQDKLEVIEYGLEGIYLTFTKIILIICLSLILGIFKKTLLLILFYNIIRFSAFGLHAKKSSHCLIMSTSLFIGVVYICEYIELSLIIKSIISLICILLISKYAPADTEKRPLINKKKRKKYKIMSILSSMIFSILIVIFNEYSISNYLLFGMFEATLMVLPISYKILDLPYDNYKRYNLNEV